MQFDIKFYKEIVKFTFLALWGVKGTVKLEHPNKNPSQVQFPIVPLILDLTKTFLGTPEQKSRKPTFSDRPCHNL